MNSSSIQGSKREIFIFPFVFCLEYQSDSDDEDSDKYNQKSGNLSAPEYKRLIAIHAGNAKNKSLRHVLRIIVDRARRLSLSEQELEKAAASHAADVVRYCPIVELSLILHL